MIVFNKTPGGIFAALFAVIIVFLSAALYEHGIITEEFYSKLLVSVQNGITETSEEVVSVHFIDVGQAECILIKTPEKNVLIIIPGK